MRRFKLDELTRLIPIGIFNKCLETGKSKTEIIKDYPGRENGAYYLDKFIKNLEENSGLTLQNYMKKHFSFDWPVCPKNKTPVGFSVGGKGIKLSKYSKGGVNKNNCPNFKNGCQKLSEKRKGRGNPMYGKTAWNKGLGLEDARIEKMVSKRRGKPLTKQHKEKLKAARALHPLKARHTTPHTKESKNRMRVATAKGWCEGRFNKVTSIHKKVREFLETLNLIEKFEEEWQVKYFSMDFAFPKHKVAIECQGTFFHIDPRIYPNGPICAIQRRNFGRDKTKKKVCCCQEGWVIIEIWETEINDGVFKKQILCELQKLNLLKI